MKEHIGKTISDIVAYGYKGYDDLPIVKITFTDNTDLILRATYGGYSGESIDEYPCFIVEGTSKYIEEELYEIPVN